LKEVVYKISPDGTRVKVEANRFMGGECQDFTKSTIRKLGFVVDEKMKPEFNMTCGNCNSIKA
jgi:hypothetical protein